MNICFPSRCRSSCVLALGLSWRVSIPLPWLCAGLVGTTLIFFVSPHALLGTLADAGAVLGQERRCCLARELTKMHEEFFRGTIEEALQEFTTRAPRGEFTMVIEGGADSGRPERTDDEIRAALQRHVRSGAAPSAAAKAAAAELQVPRRRAYALSLGLGEGGES